jgi:hypothetical protein
MLPGPNIFLHGQGGFAQWRPLQDEKILGFLRLVEALGPFSYFFLQLLLQELAIGRGNLRGGGLLLCGLPAAPG